MRRAAAVLIGAALSAGAWPSFAAVVLDNLTAKPNPARFANGYPPDIDIDIMVRDRGMTRILGCDVTVDFGDGTPDVEQRFMDGGARKITLRHVYRKKGSYPIRVKGRAAPGGRACEGDLKVQLLVVEDPRSADAAAPRDTVTTTVGCPAGWALVPGSLSGNRFRCRPDKSAINIECRGGTRYVDQDGMIGCD